MNQPLVSDTTRREFLKNTGRFAAATTIVSAATPWVHAAEDNTIRVALVGCGGRGTGAAADALNVKNGPIQLVALADVISERVSNSFNNLSRRFEKQVDVPEDRRFVGFDGYKKAMDALRPGDVVILGTPPVFRWVQFRYAIDKGLNVFMEKPVSVDAPTSMKMFKLGEESVAKNLKVGVGLMCRHCRARGEMLKRIKDGEIGDLTMLRAYRMAGRTAKESTPRMPSTETSELIWQIKWFHAFLWASGGSYSDFLIHNIDECCWMKDAWPVKAQASGGRHYRGNNVDQNFDNYSVEYTFADGAKLFLYGRTMDGCFGDHSSYCHGTKGSGLISTRGTCTIALPSIQEPGHDRCQHFLDLRQAGNGAESVPDGVGRSHCGDSRGQAVQRNRARHRGQPAMRDGPDGGPHGTDHHPRTIAEARPRICPKRRQADAGIARAAHRRRRRQVPDPNARQGRRSRIRITGVEDQFEPQRQKGHKVDTFGTGGNRASRERM